MLILGVEFIVSLYCNSTASPKYSLDESYLEVEAGGSPIMTFSVTSDPPLPEDTEHVLYKMDGSEATRRFKVESSRITFRNVREGDSGEYVIRCQDAEGNKIEATLELEVTPPTHQSAQDHGSGRTQTGNFSYNGWHW